MAATTRYCLITGCGKGGIGNALANEFVKKNYHVIATVLPGEFRKHLENNDMISVHDLDVTKEDMVKQFSSEVSSITNGKLDILVNNAGIVYTMTACDSEISQSKRLFDVNFFGAIAMVHYFHRQVVAAQGTIVNIGSIAGVSPYVYGSVYNASKAALVHFMDTLRIEIAPLGVHVMNVISGEINTTILRHDRSRSLPPDSLFSPLNQEFQDHCNRQPYNSTPEQYAQAVVREAIKKSPKRWFWWGASTTVVWLLRTFFGQWVWEYVFSGMFHLDKLKVGKGKVKGG
ncbi:NAD(P)-binding protein [Amniculicola lignicola CBS 123094]|uniref:NAD(P)-binding protein n=1 Tax=Amniculicola lignicola CBS 123094 TaxID=1392246 RepID=A0A6A5WBQ7_9PLEO|nr:NAD(P)-binding protein [Amniculicola lignicola CBS 123094]